MAVIELVEALTVAEGHRHRGRGRAPRRPPRTRRPRRRPRTRPSGRGRARPTTPTATAADADGRLRSGAGPKKYAVPEPAPAEGAEVWSPRRRRRDPSRPTELGDRRRRTALDRTPLPRTGRPRGLPGQGQRGLDEVPHAGVPVIRPDRRRGLVRHRRGRRGAGSRVARPRRGRRREPDRSEPVTDRPSPPTPIRRARRWRGRASPARPGLRRHGFAGWAAQPGSAPSRASSSGPSPRSCALPTGPGRLCRPYRRRRACPRAGRARRRDPSRRCCRRQGDARGARAPAGGRAARDIGVRAVRRAAAGLRRPLLGAVAPLRLPDQRRPGRRWTRCAATTGAGARRPLDVEAMTAAAPACWACTTSPRSAGAAEGATTVRTLLELGWDARTGRHRWWHGASPTRSATRWCARWSGASLAVGEGPAGRRLAARGAGRAASAVTAVDVAPPHGLTLEEVRYPPTTSSPPARSRARARREVPAAADPGATAGPAARSSVVALSAAILALRRRAQPRAVALTGMGCSRQDDAGWPSWSAW